ALLSLLAGTPQTQRARRAALRGVLHVRAGASGAGSGLTWSDAFADLQDALAAAKPGTQIWVAEGSYSPGPNQSDTFAIPSGVQVYGGFAGHEALLSQRDPALHPTTLTGDINGDDTYSPVFNINSVNTWNIVTFQGASPKTRLDGFTLLSGHTYGATYANNRGAGILLLSGSPRIVNCTFAQCVAAYGGALWADSGSAVVEGCTFQTNYGSDYSGKGGAIFNGSQSSLTVRASTFLGNLAEARGGGSLGGGIYNETGATLTVTDSVFSGNDALPRGGGGYFCYGGAICSFTNSLVTIDRCSFDGNTSNLGGAVYLWSSATANVTNSVFRNNRAVKVILSGGNEGGSFAAGLSGGAGTNLVGCLFYGGVADSYGGAYLPNSTVTNSIFWGNSDQNGSIGVAQVKANRVEYCCVENMLVGQPGEDPPDPAKFTGSTAADPMFVDALSGDFHLVSGSPCIDAGNNTTWPAGIVLDLDGGARFLDDPAKPDTGIGPAPIGDMGPFEFDPGA
ncbi:MAG TPA: right-handed parallel beta-helix repeat-containing protein, partial [Planctomycetes bacterium]|nr:right-handed parallel beta-helix repeat-containing protein [Planctomycetota bacterium]